MQKDQDRTRHLVMQARSGDESARERLCGIYGERVRRIVRLRMGAELRSKLESMDIVQNTLMSAVSDLDNFTYSSEGDFLRWLCAIVENQIRGSLDYFHAAKRDMRKEVPLERRASHARRPSLRALQPVYETTPSMILAKTEELDKLESAMDQLRPEYRQVIMMARIEGLPHREIAIHMGKSPEAVGMMLSRALLALTKAFERL